ncbi:MAG: ABC transporter ATP-binding protein, partial [Chloroflexi bacterium]|nr:ABC transporter ATP-binding protein [Chloroflexota bacterium]
VRVYTIGLGSVQGGVVSLDGRQIRTSLDEPTLKEIAKSTDAEYYLATNETDLRKVYENLTTQLVLKTEKTEITFAFTALAALFSMVAGALSIAWFNRLP